MPCHCAGLHHARYTGARIEECFIRFLPAMCVPELRTPGGHWVLLLASMVIEDIRDESSPVYARHVHGLNDVCKIIVSWRVFWLLLWRNLQ